MTWYAWNNFEIPDEEFPTNRSKARRITAGEEVSASDLGLTDEEFQSYVDIGAIRNYEHPDMGDFGGSPVEYHKAQLAAAAEGSPFDSQFGRVEPSKETDETLSKTEGPLFPS